MINAWSYLAVALGGALGAILRFSVARWMQPFAYAGFPAPTLLVNLLGSFLLGLVYALGKANWLQGDYRLFWATGFLGALTTFSTFAMEGILLVEAGRWKLALVYWFISLICGAALAFLGMYLGSRLAGN